MDELVCLLFEDVPPGLLAAMLEEIAAGADSGLACQLPRRAKLVKLLL